MLTEIIKVNPKNPERKIIKLRIIEEMKYEDISKELNLPLSTINYKLNNALGEIRKKLGKMKL